MGSRSLFWFRRDLRLQDNPALLAAMDAADEVLGLFIMDQEIADRAGVFRNAYLADSLRALNESMNGRLAVILGRICSLWSGSRSRFGRGWHLSS